ncbi:hypothetical protein GGR57DRAFT_251514 [Xylariaceae sp. FL1272]|nr:hypothetical protein GGR57DRAFT_251514 [Xylariaceae sp. FL1272]
MSDLDFSHYPPDQLQQVLDEPALAPPDGVIPNFENPPNENALALFGLITCLTVSTVAFVIRIYVKFWKLRKTHIGDYILIPGFLFYVVTIEGSIRRISAGPGLFIHQWDERGRDMAGYLLVIHLGILFYCGALLFIKSAILLEWIHIFVPAGTRGFFLRSCQVMIALNVGFYVALFIASNLACTPYERNWDKTLPGKCIDIKIINLASAIINLFFDIGILALPQRVIWKLNMSKKRKVEISTMFAIGILGIIAAIFRIQANVQWIKSRDMTFHFAAIALWGIAEITSAILIICAPSLPKAFSRPKLPTWAASYSQKRSRTKKSGDSWLFRPGNTTAGKSRTYEALEGGGDTSDVVLTQMDIAKQRLPPTSILRTTDTVTTSIHDVEAAASLHNKYQHPWERQ